MAKFPKVGFSKICIIRNFELLVCNCAPYFCFLRGFANNDLLLDLPFDLLLVVGRSLDHERLAGWVLKFLKFSF